MRWCRFGTDFFVCDCEKLKMYWMYIEFFGRKQAGKDGPKMCRRINQRFLYRCQIKSSSGGRLSSSGKGVVRASSFSSGNAFRKASQ